MPSPGEIARCSSSSAKISIWWDIENCQVPKNVDAHFIALNLRSALHHSDLTGPITINVFGDTKLFDHKTLEALSSTGVTINHVPSGNKDAADKAILVAMLFWALDNPPPAHFLLISGDGDFANALHRLRLKGYDILLVRPDKPVKPALLGAATSVWYWTNVAAGRTHQPEGKRVTNEDPSGVTAKASFGPVDDVQNMQCRTIPHEHSDSQHMTNSKKSNIHDMEHKMPSMSEKKKAPMVAAHSQVSEYHGNGCAFQETLKVFGGATRSELDVIAPKEQPGNLSHNLNNGNAIKDLHCLEQSSSQSGFSGTLTSKQVHEERASSNKINEFMSRRPPRTSSMPMYFGHSEKVSQEDQQAYNLNLSKITRSLEILKGDGLAPTLENLHDCLCYCESLHEKSDLKQVVDLAFSRGHVQKLTEKTRGETVFLPIRTDLWKFYDVHNLSYMFSKNLISDFCQFLHGSKNRQFFVHSRSMYEAAQRLRCNGPAEIRKLALGQVICILNQAVWKWKWLRLDNIPKFLLSVKLQELDAQGPSQEFSSFSSNSSQPQKNISIDPRPSNSVHTTPEVLQKLRAWLKETAMSKNDYDLSLVPRDFLCATGIQLEIKKLGFSKLQKLLEEFSDVVTIEVGKTGLKVLRPVMCCPRDKQQDLLCSGPQDKQQKVRVQSPQGNDLKPTLNIVGPVATVGVPIVEPIHGSSDRPASRKHPSMKKLRKWLLQLPSLQQGYDLSMIKKDFQQATGVVLEPATLGYSKVKDIVNVFAEDFYVECPRPGLSLIFSKSKMSTVSKLNPGSDCQNGGENIESLVRDGSLSKPPHAKGKIVNMQRKEFHSSDKTVDGKNLGAVETMDAALFVAKQCSPLPPADNLPPHDFQVSKIGRLLRKETDNDNGLISLIS